MIRKAIRKLTKKKQQYDAQHVTLSMNHGFKSQQTSNAQGNVTYLTSSICQPSACTGP